MVMRFITPRIPFPVLETVEYKSYFSSMSKLAKDTEISVNFFIDFDQN